MNSNPTLSLLKSPLLAPGAGGGQPITLEGSNLSGVSYVTVGSSQVVPTSKTPTSVTFVWPANTPSSTPYDISVTCNVNAAFNIDKPITSNTLRRVVYYLPHAVLLAWYAAEFYAEKVWTDLIGGVAVTSLQTPAFNSNWSNGQPALTFDGTENLQNLLAPVATQPGALFVVGQILGFPNRTYVAGGTLSNSWTAYTSSATGLPTANAGTDLADFEAEALALPNISEYVFNGVTSSVSVNGGSTTTGDAGAQNLTGITFGSFSDGTVPLLGSMSLVLLYDGVPSGDDEAIINAIATAIYAPVTIALQYSVTPVPPVTQARLHAAVAAVDLQLQGIQDMTGCTLVSDVTINSSGNVQRTVTFLLTSQFKSNFTAPDLVSANATGAWVSPFKSLYKHTLGAVLGSVVSESIALAQSF